MATAYLVRHLETESNAKGLFGDGPLDDVATERGFKQASALSVWWVSTKWDFDYCFVGDSERNRKTSEFIVGSEYGFTLGVKCTTALNEQGVGEWSGKSKLEIDQQLLADWRAGKILPLGGESDDDFEKRVLGFWKMKALPFLQEGKNLLMVASGNPIRVILGHILKTPWRNLLPALVVDNCSITAVKVNKKGECFVGPVNDTSHLKEVG